MQKIIVSSESEGVKIAKEKIYQFTDKKTALFLSGGSTPKLLYQKLARERKLRVGAVAMVDERFGLPFHPTSNELSIKNTGLLAYFKKENIKFYSMLKIRKKRGELAKEYDELTRSIFHRFKKRITILGLGVDGHTASIAPDRLDFKNPLFKKERKNLFVSEFRDPKLMSKEGSPAPPFGFGERITLTIHALSQMDFLILLVFGKEKKKALKLMFSKGSIEEIPARSLKTPKVSKKTLLITDQKI